MDTQPQILELIFNTISDKSADRSTALLSTRNLINSSSQENINSSEPDTAALKHLLNLLKQRSNEGTLIIAAMHELDIVQGHFSRAVLLSGEVIADGAPTRVIPTLYKNPNLSEVTV